MSISYVDNCESNSCENGGTCVGGINSSLCNCGHGYTGDQCETNIDECESNPCQNGGTCLDYVNAYTCQCAGNFDGPVCSYCSSWYSGSMCETFEGTGELSDPFILYFIKIKVHCKKNAHYPHDIK